MSPELQQHFSDIYDQRRWTDAIPGMPRSGRGSLPEFSAGVTEYLREQIASGTIRSVADIGCGDLTYISEIEEITSGQIAYTGYDIVPSLIEEHRGLGWGRFEVADLTAPEFRVDADLVIVKDVLFHLTNEDVERALDNLRASPWQQVLITHTEIESNFDRVFDYWHYAPLDLRAAPFALQPVRSLERKGGGAVDVYLPGGLARAPEALRQPPSGSAPGASPYRQSPGRGTDSVTVVSATSSADDRHQEVVDLWKTKEGADWAYYEAAESDDWSRRFWEDGGIFPELFSFLDLTRTIEIASGIGRHSARIVDRAGEIVLTDTSVDGLAAADERFKDHPHVSTVLSLDGLTIPGLEDGSFTSAFSYDAMVHFELDAVASYLAEIHRLVQPGGYALIHHSNLSQRPGGKLADNPGWRNYMTTDLFTHLARRRSLEVVRQEVLDWAIPGSDALTLLRRT